MIGPQLITLSLAIRWVAPDRLEEDDPCTGSIYVRPMLPMFGTSLVGSPAAFAWARRHRTARVRVSQREADGKG